MGIIRKPTVKPAADPADAFIDGAPDAHAGRASEASAKRGGGRVYKQRKIPVSFTAEQDLLAAFDAKAESLGMSRAALLALAMSRTVNGAE